MNGKEAGQTNTPAWSAADILASERDPTQHNITDQDWSQTRNVWYMSCTASSKPSCSTMPLPLYLLSNTARNVENRNAHIALDSASKSGASHSRPNEATNCAATLPTSGAANKTYEPKQGLFEVAIMLFIRAQAFSKKYPLTRGMAVYAVIWPVSCLCQQVIAGNKQLDYMQAGRFCLFGCFFVAPTLHTWLTLARSMWPAMNIKTAIIKALLEQVTYTPFAYACFFFGMTLLEGRGVQQATTEVKAKFLPTYKVGASVWPVIQTINYTFVPERNRVPFVGMCSFLWTCFLAYMKQLDVQKNLVRTSAAASAVLLPSNRDMPNKKLATAQGAYDTCSTRDFASTPQGNGMIRPHGISETDPTVNHGGNNKASIKPVTRGLGPIKLVFANDGLLAQAGHGPNNSICRHPSRDGEMLQLKISNLIHKQVIWKWLDNYFIVHQT
uniref:Mpv17-like protein n=1 Tax=Timema cristinae TaxID=61476 RepID=A0A7R9CDW8_TIMCR|nr:unnamed protein product [Timema cristinae]